MTSRWTIPSAIVFGGVVVALAIYYSIAPPKPAPDSGTGNPALVRPIGASDHILGSPTAPIVIVEYSDFDCSYCKGFNDILHQVIANEGADGKVAWIFRHLPITEKHINAMKHAEAAECAAKVAGNDAFWKFADALFANQPADPARYGEFALKAGIQTDAFTKCYTNAAKEVDERINADRENALAIGANGAPYSLILVKGKAPIVMEAAWSYDAIKLLLDTALTK